MLNAMLATALGSSTGAAVLPASGELYTPARASQGTFSSQTMVSIDPYVYLQPARHFISLTNEQSLVMERAIRRTAVVLHEGFLAE